MTSKLTKEDRETIEKARSLLWGAASLTARVSAQDELTKLLAAAESQEPPTQQPSEWIDKAAMEIRNTPFAEADLLMGLFDTGKEDKSKCEQLIIERIAAIIAKHAPKADARISQLETELSTLRQKADGLEKALSLIAECGGKYTEIACNGSWCGEQARQALAAYREGKG